MDIPRVLYALGIEEGYRDTSSYQALVDTAADSLQVPSEATMQAKWQELVADRIAPAKAQGKAMLAAAAEAARQRVLTPGGGKATVYMIKREEARRWAAVTAVGGTPVLTDYPWLAARATRRGETGQVVADEWTGKAAAWEQLGRAIEDVYEAAVEAVEALAQPETIDADVQAIVAAAVFP